MSITTSFTVDTLGQLNAAIAAIDLGGSSSAVNTAYAITVSNDFVLTGNIAAIDLAAGDSLLITGNDPATNTVANLDGNNAHRGFVVAAGAVTLDSLILTNLQATGGTGGAGASPGGGAAGLGGAVFVGAGATVAIANTSFSGNAAAGGNGGAVSGSGIGAGGASGLPGGFGSGAAGGTAGGFGGGGGGGKSGGFGAGGNGGGGLAAGGNMLVEQGGTLVFAAGAAASSVDAGQLAGGAGHGSGGAGSTYGSGIFVQGNNSITLGDVSVTGVIADQSGSGGTGANAGAGTVLIAGAATLAAHNSYSGGTQILGSSTLSLQAAGASGSGAIAFTAPGETLIIGKGDAPADTIDGFGFGDSIDVQGLGKAPTVALGAGNLLTAQGATSTATLQLDPAVNYGNDTFQISAAGVVTITPTHFTVASEADLNAVLTEIDAGGIYATHNLAYSITFASGFTLDADLYAINLAKGDSLAIDGAGQTLNGGGAWRGFFVYGGVVSIQDLTIADAVATGGAGGAGAAPGGGGAGLGGGLFVAAGASVTLTDVGFQSDRAVGGNAGGVVALGGYGGGGGLGGAGGAGNNQYGGGGGGVGATATGGSAGAGAGAGILLGAGGASSGTGTIVGAYPGGGGAFGGGGGVAGRFSGSGRDPRSSPGTAGSGGVASQGNFGGGAGTGQAAGFGGGGAAFDGAVNGTLDAASGNGGWGGGAGGGVAGFGGGGGLAGGGLGAGGGVFVQQGGTLTIGGGTITGGSVAGGMGAAGGGNGAAYGSGIFLQGNNRLNLAPAVGQMLGVGNAIADQAGSGGSTGRASLSVSGAGTVELLAANRYTGGTTLNAGTLELLTPGAAGTGSITFSYGALATLVIGPGDVPANTINFFLPGQTIDLQGIGTATSATLGAGDILAVTGGTTGVQLTLDPAQLFTGESFAVTSDGKGGTDLTAVTVNNDHPPFISGTAANGNDHTPFAPLAKVTVQDLDAAQIETATLKLASTANGTLSNLAGGSYDAATGIYTLSGTAAAVKAALDGLIFTPTEHQVAPGSTVQTGFSLAVTDGIMDAAATYHVAVAAVNDPPTISGGGTQPDAYWNVPFAPFTGMTIADPDVGASETVTIGIGSPDYFALGTLALAQPVDGVSLTQTGTGVYQLTAGSPAAVTAALDAVTFTPSTTNPALGFTISYLTVSVADGIAPPVTAPWIEVSAGLPIITGTVAGQTVVDTATIDPFSKVTITDSAAFTSEAITITVENTLGAATDANGKLSGTGLTKIGVGTYALPAGTPAAVSAALDALVFTPTPHQVQAGQSVTSTFVLSVFDGATTSDNYDTTVIATAPASAATASAFLMPTGREWLARAGLSARDLGAGLLGGGRSQWENWHASGVSARGAEGFGAAASLATAGAKDAGPGVYPTGEPFGR